MGTECRATNVRSVSEVETKHVDLAESQTRAAWVQAFGSIVTIAASILVAVWQSRKQQKNTIASLLAERQQEHLQTAETLAELARLALKLISFYVERFNSREAVTVAFENDFKFDRHYIENYVRLLDRIELHLLPRPLISPALLLTEGVRQFKITVVDVALPDFRSMDADDYQNFFRAIEVQEKSLEETLQDFQSTLSELKRSTRPIL
jgi:hypothetical protein